LEDINSFNISKFIIDTDITGYRLFTNPTINKVSCTFNRTEYLWHEFYQHYGNIQKYHANDIFIKADDDIVYIDTTQFQNFINAIKPGHIYFPNIVNNDVGLVIQANNGIESFKNIVEYYEKYGINFTEKFNTYYNVTDKLKYPKMPYICPISSPICDDENDFIDFD
jgi:hypothetical protein